MARYCVIITPANVPLRRIDYMGGLEAIKRMLGVTRSEDTTGITVVTTQVPKTAIVELRYAGTIRDVADTIIKPGI